MNLFKKYSTISFIGVLLLFAFFYYGYYYRCSLYPAGEGGCEGVTALRLLEGQVPMKEVILGYNLLWFYPIVALFKIFGPSYTFLRIYFFLIATATSLLAFTVIKITTRHSWLAFLGAILVLILPGQLFRNYMAFLAMLNMAFFLKTFLLPCASSRRRLIWMTASGAVLGLTFLIRVDLGFFFHGSFFRTYLPCARDHYISSHIFSFKALQPCFDRTNTSRHCGISITSPFLLRRDASRLFRLFLRAIPTTSSNHY
ncbi:MAG: hypothetical protein K2W99_08340 [Chthoniobacterales bacterium]|nr:hypothetical protein [Chthoniobacterales bacterium]